MSIASVEGSWIPTTFEVLPVQIASQDNAHCFFRQQRDDSPGICSNWPNSESAVLPGSAGAAGATNATSAKGTVEGTEMDAAS